MFNRCPFCKSLNLSYDFSGKFQCTDCGKGSDLKRVKQDEYLDDASKIVPPTLTELEGDDTFIPVYTIERKTDGI